MQEDYVREIDLTMDDELVLEIRRQVFDKSHVGGITHQPRS